MSDVVGIDRTPKNTRKTQESVRDKTVDFSLMGAPAVKNPGI
jgi:hypothetical protein